jgi:hypothetical protein
LLTIFVLCSFGGCSCSAPFDPGRGQAKQAQERDLSGPQQGAADVDSLLERNQQEPRADDLGNNAENPLIRGMGELINNSPILNEDEAANDLRTNLRDADTALSRIKRENRDALRQINRQVRIRNRNSPNIILLTIAGLSTSELGCYESTVDSTPVIDAVASAGVRFTNYHAIMSPDSQPAWCLMTGMRQKRRGLTLPSLMWYAGYTTAVIGDCTLGDVIQGAPQRYGFDESFGVQESEALADEYPDYVWSNGARIRLLANANGKEQISATEYYTREVLTHIDRHRSGRPFFLWLAYPMPSDTTKRNGQLAAVDASIQKLVAQLQQHRMVGNTIIVLTSHDRRADTDSSSLPLIVYARTRFPGGAVVDHECGAWDVSPTILQMVGAMNRPRNIEGQSLLGVLKAAKAEADKQP